MECRARAAGLDLDRFRMPDERLLALESVTPERARSWCGFARAQAEQLARAHATRSALEIAEMRGIAITRAGWNVAAGRIVYLAECRLRPPEIRLNRPVLERITAVGLALAGRSERDWFTYARVEEAAAAHELFHITSPRPAPRAGLAGGPVLEHAAHAFARALLDLEFSPLVYAGVARALRWKASG